MFYDVLMQKRAAERGDRSSKRDDALREGFLAGGGTALGSAGGLGVATGLHSLSKAREARAEEALRRGGSPTAYQRARDAIEARRATDPLVAAVVPSDRAKYMYNDKLLDEYGKTHQRGVIHDGSSASSLLHELGHSTGERALLKRPLSPLYWSGVGGLVGKSALTAGLASRAETEEELDELNKRRRWGTALGLGLTAPLLAEEARANVRGYRLGKKFGANVGPGAYAAPWLTYAAAPIGAAYLGHRLESAAIDRRREELRR